MQQQVVLTWFIKVKGENKCASLSCVWHIIRMLLLLITFALINICLTVIIGSSEPELQSQSELDSNPSSTTQVSVRHWPSYVTVTCFLTHKILPTSHECLAQNLAQRERNPSRVPIFIILLLVIIESAVSEKKFALEPETLTLMPVLLMPSCREWVLFQVFLHPTRIVPLLSQEPSGPGLGNARSICSSLPCQRYPCVRSLGQGLFTYSSSPTHLIQFKPSLLNITWSKQLCI